MTSRTHSCSVPDADRAPAAGSLLRRRSLAALALSTVAALSLQVAPAFAGPPSFATATSLDNTGAGANAVAIGDLDGDNVPDLATAIRSEGLAVLLGTGGGSFGLAEKYPAPASPASRFVSSVVMRDAAGDEFDLNGDNNPDVVSQSARDNVALAYFGDGDGALSAASPVQLNPAPGCGTVGGNPCLAAFPVDVAVGDFDEDGESDIATANSTTDNVAVALGNGDGTFAPATRHGLGGGDNPQQILAADVDGDNDLDLVTVNSTSASVTVLLGDGAGGFTASNSASGVSLSNRLKLADFDEDGNLDVVVTNGALAGAAAVRLGNGLGGFGTPSTLSSGANPSSVSAADLNGDGHVDLAFTDASTDDVLVLVGDGDGAFTSPLTFGLNGGDNPAGAVVGDLDADGRPDIVTANNTATAGYVKDASVLLNTSNRAPVAVNDSYTQYGSDTALSVAAPGVLGNDTDADANALTAVQVTGTTHGSLTLNSDGSFTYQPNAGFVGSDSFTYKAYDGTDDSNIATVTITVATGCNGLAATITGSGSVSGTSGNDVIVTGGSADAVSGGNGNDSICTFGGNDAVSGGAGNDYINAGDGNDSVSGGDNTDTIRGGAGNDALSGGNGNDLLLGQAGNDNLSGGNGNDTVVGGADSDTLAGNGDTDVCAGDDNGGPTLAGTDMLALLHGCETVVEVP